MRSFLRSLVLVPVMLLGACAQLQPVELPDAPVSPASNAPAWDVLDPGFAGDWHVLLNDGPTALDWRLFAIDSATETIDIQTFLLTLDTVGAAVIDHLIAAADRGVRVRFLIDDSFLQGEDELVMLVHQHENMAFRVFNPYLRRGGGAITRQALNLAEFHRLDHRMHNKAMIVDGRVAIVGGRNLADEYFGLHGEANFRDLELIVGGPVVARIEEAFVDYWNDDWSLPIDQLTHVTPTHVDDAMVRALAGDAAALHDERDGAARAAAWQSLMGEAVPGASRLLVDEPPDENPALESEAPVQVANALMDLFDSAREEVVIVSAYFIPTEALESAIRRAEARGVSVRILTNSIRSNNHLSAHSAYRNHIAALLGFGADVYEVRADAADRTTYIRPPVSGKVLGLHAKALIIDHDRVFIGSANLDPRSLRINTEMGLVVTSEALNAVLREAVAPDFAAGNAWNLRYDDAGKVTWVSGDEVLTAQPVDSAFQRLEDWFFAHLPIEDEL
ncbi:MAG: phospholipase D family protein [Xanthomonadales bacterium]|nr:phospholipase D family protein [Xanthomonadales bacterium]